MAFLARVGDELYWEVWPDKVSSIARQRPTPTPTPLPSPPPTPHPGVFQGPHARPVSPCPSPCPPAQLVLSAINSSRSALAKCTFHAPFFRRFAVTARSGADEPVLECRVLNKVVQLLFKKRPGSVAHDVDEVILRHLPEENRLGFVFVCKHGARSVRAFRGAFCTTSDVLPSQSHPSSRPVPLRPDPTLHRDTSHSVPIPPFISTRPTHSRSIVKMQGSRGRTSSPTRTASPM